jgi:DNA polymerase I
VALIQRHRTLTKLIGTYCTIPEDVAEDGRYHAEFNQLGAQTGRLTSNSVIQTLPKADEFGIRRGFIASPGTVIVGADFVQQELYVLAAVSRDDNLLAAIRAGIDLHGLAAVKVFGLDCPPQEVRRQHPQLRDRVKAIQFGIIYGRSPQSLAAALGIPLEEGEELLRGYFREFPGVKRLVDEVHERVGRDGYIDDLFGRRRYLPDALLQPPRGRPGHPSPRDRHAAKKAAALRAAQNFVIQGASATITKLAMVRCHRHVAAEHPGIRMILTLHDELHFEVPEAEVDHLAAELPGLMCELGLERFEFGVALAVDVKAGPSWGDLKPYQPREGHSDG